MLTRREFLGTTSAALALAGLGQNDSSAAGTGRMRLALIATLWIYQSHAQHIGDRFLVGYPHRGKWHRPEMDVVAAYVDQKPAGDLSGERAKSFGFTVYPTIRGSSVLRRQQAGRRRRPHHRRARELPAEREGANPLPAVRVLQTVRLRL